MDNATLLAKRREAAKKKPRIQAILRGSLVIVKRYCGKGNCRCLKGRKHRSVYISQSNNGQSRLIYIPQRSEKEVRCLIDNYRKLKSVMEEISRINMHLVTMPRAKHK